MYKLKRERNFVLCLLAAAAFALPACGDDLSVGVSALTIEDIEQPVSEKNAGAAGQVEQPVPGGEHKGADTGTGSNAGAESSNAGEESGDTGTAGSGADSREPVTITISAAGDVSLGNHQNQDYYYSFRQAYDQTEDDGYFFQNVYDIFSKDDMTIVNLEGTLTYSQDMLEGQTYCIKGDPEYAALLTGGSIEAVSMGNNHRLDYGKAGSQETVKAVEDEGIVYAFDENVGIYETKGIRIGFVSVNEVYWGAGVEKTIQSGIEKLQEEQVDLIVACCHWGIEREYYPEAYQQTLGRKCIDWGADLVIGHHPHVLQGVEEYQGKYIVYSLGNFCFGANRNPADKDCMIFQQTFTFIEGEKQEEAPVRVIPCSVSSVSSRNDFVPTPALGDEAQRILDKINECSRDFGVQFDGEGYRKEQQKQ